MAGFCRKCGSPLGKDAMFCKKCGSRVMSVQSSQTVRKQVQPQKIQCRSCGYPLKEGAVFCKKCGTKVIEQQAVQPAIKETQNLQGTNVQHNQQQFTQNVQGMIQPMFADAADRAGETAPVNAASWTAQTTGVVANHAGGMPFSWQASSVPGESVMELPGMQGLANVHSRGSRFGIANIVTGIVTGGITFGALFGTGTEHPVIISVIISAAILLLRFVFEVVVRKE